MRLSDEAWAWLRVRDTIRRCIAAAAAEHMRMAEELMRRGQDRGVQLPGRSEPRAAE